MLRRRQTPGQLVRKLAEADQLLGQGKTIEDLPRPRDQRIALDAIEKRWDEPEAGI